MVAPASGAETEFAGRAGVVCGVVGDGVVEVAAVGGYAAAGELAGLVSGDDESGQVCGWSVAGDAVVQWAA
jgi:hypothetical protein